MIVFIIDMIGVPLFSGNSTRNVGPNPVQSQNMTHALFGYFGVVNKRRYTFVIPDANNCSLITLEKCHMDFIYENDMCPCLSTVHSWILTAHFHIAALILRLTNGFYLTVRSFKPPAWNHKQLKHKNVDINVTGGDKVTKRLIIIRK